MNCSKSCDAILRVDDCLDFIPRKNVQQNKDSHETEVEVISSYESEEIESESDTFSNIDTGVEPLVCRIDLPIPDPSILNFTESLLVSVKPHITTPDTPIPTLIDTSISYDVVGGICVNVQVESGVLSTFIAAQYSSCGNTPKCIEIVSVCDRYLKLLNEKKVDTSCEVNLKEEKSLMVFFDDCTNTYVGVKKNNRVRHRGEIILNKTGDLILAGQNFLLLRYIATSKFHGDFQAWTLDMNGHICLSHYHVECPQEMYLNKKRYSIIKITRIIQRPRQQMSTNNTENVHEIYHYLPTGHLIKYESCFSEFIWHINPLSRVPTFGNVATHVESHNDVELLAMYLDKKNDLQRKHLNEVLDKRPAIKSIIRDYVLCLVHNKPANVLDFTLEYFVTLKQRNREY